MAVTLQQIAEACGVSRGTVDRALHGKEGVRQSVAQAIRDKAREMGYVPRGVNPLAEVRPVRLGIVLHTGASDFVRQLSDAFVHFPAQAMLPIEVVVRVMEGTDVYHQIALIDELVESEQIDGLVLMPLANTLLREQVNALSARSIPVVTVNTDIADCNRLAYVGPDNIACGRTAAALMGMTIGRQGRVLPMLGQRSGHYADSQRLSGFLSEMGEHFPDVSVLRPEFCYLDPDLAERITLRALEEIEDLSGIYISSVGRSGVYRAIQKAGKQGQIHVVVHDLSRDNLQMIRAGVVDFAIGQAVRTQGTLPLQLLYQFLTRRQAPDQRQYTVNIEIKFRCNL